MSKYPSGNTNHIEVVKILYDNDVISLTTILGHLFRFIDPTITNRQGNDVGRQYQAGIYYSDLDDGKTIKEFLALKQKEYHQKIMVEVEPLGNYYPAENHHQQYLQKNPFGYCHVDLNIIKKEEAK